MIETLAILLGSPAGVAIPVAIVTGWIVTTWLRVRHGYPLEGSWGQTIKPVTSNETIERLKLVTSENAQLQAEVGALKDRVQTLERIATDRGSLLSSEIEKLRN
jgi:hypothetical protein